MRKTAGSRLFALAVALLVGALRAQAADAPNSGVARVTLRVSALPELARFYREALGFRPVTAFASGPNPLARLFNLPGPAERSETLAIGSERIVLRESRVPGRALYPRDGRSNDLVFQHLALVVGDLDTVAQRVLAHGAEAISAGPQTIPRENPAAGGIRAFYFRDPDRHPLELIWFPKGKGAARWQTTAHGLLGIDHTAIAVADTARSVAFYRDVAGLTVRGQSFNEGTEQAALSGVPGARVQITSLGGGEGPGVELLAYQAPSDGRKAERASAHGDLADSETTLYVPALDAALRAAAAQGVAIDPTLAFSVQGARAQRLRDPDGHALRLVQR